MANRGITTLLNRAPGILMIMRLSQGFARRPARGVGDEGASAPVPFDPADIRLTGHWSVDDGGMYYIRQIGDTIWWNGMSDYAQVDRLE